MEKQYMTLVVEYTPIDTLDIWDAINEVIEDE